MRGTRVVQYDRRKGEIFDEAKVTEKFGVPPRSIADYLALVGDSADGYPGLPGWGSRSAATVLAKFGSITDVPTSSRDWGLPALRGAEKLAGVLVGAETAHRLFTPLDQLVGLQRRAVQRRDTLGKGALAEQYIQVLIAQVPAGTGFREFTKYPAQTSGVVVLQAQQKYYVELLHKAGTGPDHFSVGWKPPGATNFSVIPADNLAPAGLDRTAPAQNKYLDTLATARPRLLASPPTHPFTHSSP